ncbi:MAG TPA: hypothetical protein VFO41_10145 [Alphaproteobacteria bacterium]|nr:hypothetical protein [Alphaproteobacteria bacterium]
MRQSTWLYPIANLLHLLGLTLLVGAMVLLDLRLLGTARSVPLAPFSRFLTPVAIAGLTIMLASGFSLFAADGAPLAGNPIFQIKAAIIALGIANALTFRALWRRSLPSWDQHPPALGRAQAALSLALWCSAATAGRLIAYF